ncbi:MAG: hypothetical protein HYU85_01255 [Chloroflexi bacterium]|nr:hypothetical protein [Chloroflexota bacterium]MBI2980453.1 hypothetical protein [Chloroflexota bacterium]
MVEAWRLEFPVEKQAILAWEGATLAWETEVLVQEATLAKETEVLVREWSAERRCTLPETKPECQPKGQGLPLGQGIPAYPDCSWASRIMGEHHPVAEVSIHLSQTTPLRTEGWKEHKNYLANIL